MGMSPEAAAEMVAARFDQGFSCAESVLMVLQEVYDLEGEKLLTAAAGFGGGLGRLQSVCGAVAGAVIALGLHEGQSVADQKAEPKKVSTSVRPKVREFVERFQAEFGAIECRALLPFDFNVPGGFEAFQASGIKQQTCHRYVRFAVEMLAKQAAD